MEKQSRWFVGGGKGEEGREKGLLGRFPPVQTQAGRTFSGSEPGAPERGCLAGPPPCPSPALSRRGERQSQALTTVAKKNTCKIGWFVTNTECMMRTMANTLMTNFKHLLQFLRDLKAVPALDFNNCSLEAAAYQSDTNCVVNRLWHS